MIFHTFILRLFAIKKNLTKFIDLGNYLSCLFCKQGISNQQIYFYIFLLIIKYVIPNLKHKSIFFLHFFKKKSYFTKNQEQNVYVFSLSFCKIDFF